MCAMIVVCMSLCAAVSECVFVRVVVCCVYDCVCTWCLCVCMCACTLVVCVGCVCMCCAYVCFNVVCVGVPVRLYLLCI